MCAGVYASGGRVLWAQCLCAVYTTTPTVTTVERAARIQVLYVFDYYLPKRLCVSRRESAITDFGELSKSAFRDFKRADTLYFTEAPPHRVLLIRHNMYTTLTRYYHCVSCSYSVVGINRPTGFFNFPSSRRNFVLQYTHARQLNFSFIGVLFQEKSIHTGIPRN